MASHFLARLKRWLFQKENSESRRTPRLARPEVVVYYWDGSAPEGRRLRDINSGGAYIYTPERWYIGTIVRIVLQGKRTTTRDDGTVVPAVSTSVPARVLRHGPDGVAVEFAFRDAQERQAFGKFLASIPVQPAAPAPAPTGDREGQALVEFALMVPLVFLLVVNAVNFGGFIFAWITVANAARAGAQYMVRSTASPGAPTAPTSAAITGLVTNDITSLLNRSSLVVATCTNATSSSNSCTTLSDPEAPNYTLATVDVTYTYVPFISAFTFSKLGISATLPATKVHRKAVMRMMQ